MRLCVTRIEILDVWPLSILYVSKGGGLAQGAPCWNGYTCVYCSYVGEALNGRACTCKQHEQFEWSSVEVCFRSARDQAPTDQGSMHTGSEGIPVGLQQSQKRNPAVRATTTTFSSGGMSRA